jgi:acyl-CoA synthetase (AMP-forming)/AMP-acid ligase II
MYEFNGRAKDTIIYTLGNISGSDIADTIKNHVYILNDTVIVESWWIKNNDTLWHYEYGDEFVDNTGSELSYDPDEQGIWATFTTGIYFVIPDLTPTTSGMDSAMIVDNGLSDLRKLGINVTGKDYATFLHRFHGDVISFGEPEREDSWIWYGPAKRFVHYYIP